jgi:hypothetical protein
VYNAPVCSDRGQIIQEASASVFLNGVLVQNHARIRPKEIGCRKGPLLIQDHSGFRDAPETPLRFRNIWYRSLDQ